jgi:hypothetical protein
VRKLVPVVFEQQVLGGTLLAGASAGVIAVIAGERRGIAAAAILLAAGGIYFAVVWRLSQRDRIGRALARAKPAPEAAGVEPRWLTALRGLGLAWMVGALAFALGYLHLLAVSIVILLGFGLGAVLRAARIAGWEREHGQTVLRAPGDGFDDTYVLRERTIDTSLPLVPPPAGVEP